MASRRNAGAVLALAATLGACSGADRPEAIDRPGDIPQAPVILPVNIVATDFAFEMPDTVVGGVVLLNLVNRGKELHHATIVKLEDGKSIENFMAAMQQPGPPPPWAKFVGGPNPAEPGQTIHGAAILTPGNYLTICFIPSPDGPPHVAKGMVRPFTVTGSDSIPAVIPASADTITLSDYDFKPSRPLTKGKHTFVVVNNGPQPHEIVLVRLAPEKTIKDFGDWGEGGLKGPSPAFAVGGVAAMDPGRTAQFTADLTPGDYGMICFVPDLKDGKAHLVHGMMKQFKVES
jgi:hypothetical protein